MACCPCPFRCRRPRCQDRCCRRRQQQRRSLLYSFIIVFNKTVFPGPPSNFFGVVRGSDPSFLVVPKFHCEKDFTNHPSDSVAICSVTSVVFKTINVVYYESIKRELKIRPIYECRCFPPEGIRGKCAYQKTSLPVYWLVSCILHTHKLQT
jgi:hypothetical protein